MLPPAWGMLEGARESKTKKHQRYEKEKSKVGKQKTNKSKLTAKTNSMYSSLTKVNDKRECEMVKKKVTRLRRGTKQKVNEGKKRGCPTGLDLEKR